MDKVGEIALTWNFRVLKEPRGFIKVLQFILAIFAFATTTSHSTYSSFMARCSGSTDPAQLMKIEYGYSYRLTNSKFDIPLCPANNTYETTRSPCCDFNAPAEFFVFVGVMAFLYSLAGLVLYICFDEKYRQYDQVPTIDFVVTIALAVLWLIASAAWADGVVKVKTYTDPDELYIKQVQECQNDGVLECTEEHEGNFASLNVSLIFGFLNIFVWGGNLWFLYKETKWFKVTTQHPEASPSEAPQKGGSSEWGQI